MMSRTSALAVVLTAPALMMASATDAFAAPPPTVGPVATGPDPHPGLPGGVEAKLNTLLGMGMSIVIVACVAGVFICAGKMAMAIRHGEGGEAAGKLAAVGFACILVGSGAGIVNYLV